MKKLIIAMSAATMAALYAQAAIPTDAVSGIDFEKVKEANLGNLNVLLDDTNSQEGTDLKFWASAAASTEQGTTGQVESQIVDGSQIQDPGNTGKFLKVDETVPLQRSMAGVDEKGIPKPTSVGDGIEISSSVQFTAADEAPKPNDGDKLLVWMQAAAEAEGTEGEPGYKPAKKAGIMVTDATGPTMIKELAESEVETFTAAWHTLVIKSTVTGDVGLETLAFKVTLDGVEAAKTFASLVDSTVASATTISSIGFQGTGAVDDIVFKTLAAAKDVKVTVSCNSDFYVGTEFGEYDSATGIVAKDGSDVVLMVEATAANVTCEQAKSIVQGTDNLANYTIITVTASNNLQVTITIGEGPTPPTPIQPSINPAAGESTITIRAATSSAAEEQAIAAITAPSGVDAAKYKTYFMATAVAAQDGSYTVTVGLDPAVVTPAVVDNANLDIAAGAITVSSKVGLYYSLVKGTTLSTITSVVDTQAGTGEVLKLVDSTTKGDAAFYKVSVTAVTPATTETTEE